MKSIRYLLTALVAAVAVTAVAQGAPALAGNEANPNETAYWENWLGAGATCVKHNPGDVTADGAVTNGGKAVTLSASSWALLVVNSGSTGPTGNGNLGYSNPVAGTAYFGPLNGGGQQGNVSHWIVCGSPTPPPSDDIVVPTEPPTFVDPTCDDAAEAMFPATEGVTYTASGPAAPGATITVTATANPGYVLSGATEWTHTFATVDETECDDSETPTTTEAPADTEAPTTTEAPTGTETPATTETPIPEVESEAPTTTEIPTTTDPTQVDSQAETTTEAPTTVAPTTQLPKTGNDHTTLFAIVAMVLLGGGVALSATAARRRS